jgi:hypothetical protein
MKIDPKILHGLLARRFYARAELGLLDARHIVGRR